MTTVASSLESVRGRVTVVHVIEKTRGAPDAASIEQRRRRAETIFDSVVTTAANAGIAVETEREFGTDVARTVTDLAAGRDVDAIVFTPRGGSRLTRLLTGDVTHSLLESADRPVIALPDV